MSQDLTLNLKTTSDVPEAMNKAKAAAGSFAKQVEDIGMKFKTSFKDIFLSALGPMALIATATALIGKLIADNQKKQEEANQAAIDGTNELMSAEDRYWARKKQREQKEKETIEQAKTTREDTTREFLQTDPRGRQMLFDYADEQRKKGSSKYGPVYASQDKAMQDKVQALIAEDAKKNPITVEVKEEAAQKAGTFKGPEGFGAVVGIGANPVLEKMTRQNEIMEEIKLILQEQSIINRGGAVPNPFTERQPITLQKIGAV